jgi:hypothetical protein
MTRVVGEDDANPVRNTGPWDNTFIYLFICFTKYTIDPKFSKTNYHRRGRRGKPS